MIQGSDLPLQFEKGRANALRLNKNNLFSCFLKKMLKVSDGKFCFVNSKQYYLQLRKVPRTTETKNSEAFGIFCKKTKKTSAFNC